jgi:hypothetical protein
MSDAVIAGVAVVVGLACPAHMWWSHRCGRHAACCPSERDVAIEALRARQERLRVLIAEHDAAPPPSRG